MKWQVQVLWLVLFGLAAPVVQADSRFDGRLREVIHDRFYNDARVLSKDINVETRNQEVTLRGTVRSPAERAAALEIVTATPDVRRITNELEVRPGQRADKEILRDALQLTPSLAQINGSSVVIGVENQVVTVQGVYPTLAALDRVIAGLMTVAGVKDVTARASIIPPAEVTDDHLLVAVAQSLMTDGTVDASKIRVGVRNGVVVLEGQSENLYELVRAGEITRNLTGVRAVQNRLTLGVETGDAPVG